MNEGERERERERERQTLRFPKKHVVKLILQHVRHLYKERQREVNICMYVCVCMCVYIDEDNICMYTKRDREK